MYPDISICICIKYTFCVFCYGSFELGNYLFTRNASASLLDNIELVKVSPFSREYGGAQRCGRMRACGGWDANHYSFEVQTPRARLGCSLIQLIID